MSLNVSLNVDKNVKISMIIEEDKIEEDKIEKEQSFIKKKIIIDYTKTSFTEDEKNIIRNEVEVINQQYPGYIPIIVRAYNNKNNKNFVLTKTKFLVTNEITLAQFLTILRKKIKDIKSTESIYLLIDNTLMPITLAMSSIYKEKKDKDTNMLFITVCKENTFGCTLP
jgi:hypothetical protein